MIGISAFTCIHDGIRIGYPLVEAVLSVVPFVDEYVIANCESSDGTGELLSALKRKSPKIRIEERPWPNDGKDGGAIRKAQNDAMGLCSNECVWLVQADEIWWPGSCAAAVDSVYAHPEVACFSFEFLHFVGFHHVMKNPAYRWAARIVRKVAGVESAGDGWTFLGSPAIQVSTPHPIHHYGWSFEEGNRERMINCASLWDDDNAKARKAAAEAGVYKLEQSYLDSQEKFGRAHPPILADLIDVPKYFIRKELLTPNS